MEESPLIREAKVAENLERFEDMAKCMKKFVETECDGKLSNDNRNLLSVAYKNVVGARRNAWRVIMSLEGKRGPEDQEDPVLVKYKEVIRTELDEICKEVFSLVEKLLKSVTGDEDAEAFIFYKKMVGDYYRYLCEVATEEKRKDMVKKSSEAYKEAYEKAEKTLSSTNPIRLGLALNFSVFHYEIAEKPDEACKLAKSAFDEAITEMESISSEESYKDSSLILQLLRDNLTLWTQDEEPADQD